jgi:hypothetical protein
MKTIDCYNCLSKIELKEANNWTTTARFKKSPERPRFITYSSKSSRKTYYVAPHSCLTP